MGLVCPSQPQLRVVFLISYRIKTGILWSKIFGEVLDEVVIDNRMTKDRM